MSGGWVSGHVQVEHKPLLMADGPLCCEGLECSSCDAA